jgi:hypothetical protein
MNAVMVNATDGSIYVYWGLECVAPSRYSGPLGGISRAYDRRHTCTQVTRLTQANREADATIFYRQGPMDDG